MARSHTPVTVTEMPTYNRDAAELPDRLIARFAQWEDAALFAAAKSAANDGRTFFQVRFHDGLTIGTENFLKGKGGDYVCVDTPKMSRQRAALSAARRSGS